MAIIKDCDDHQKVYHSEDLFYIGSIRQYFVRDDNHILYKVDLMHVDEDCFEEDFIVDSYDEALSYFDWC